MATYRKIDLQIRHGSRYGHYIVSAFYRGEYIECTTTDSEAYDWLNDDSNKEKHRDAKRHCYNKIRDAYELRKEHRI